MLQEAPIKWTSFNEYITGFAYLLSGLHFPQSKKIAGAHFNYNHVIKFIVIVTHLR